MDKVFIEGLEVLTTIGVYEWEKGIKQKLSFDLEMLHDNRPSAQQDDCQLALNYAEVSQAVTQFAQQHQFELIETMSEQVAALILEQFNAQQVRVRLSKPGAVVNARNVGVEITRTREV
ncbi:dihydroneopterin aldolase [Dongshaea marina]|uniref:dihydroneopterin aldolase n=1 Tax=Dongshaea marina TaxID=2047966 RepID=UPI000D3E5354|nr:dihydroneopterin aldolase [Dongshaea marina]